MKKQDRDQIRKSRKRQRAKEAKAAEARRKLRDRLALPVIPQEVVRQVQGRRWEKLDSSARDRALEQLSMDILTFGPTDEAVRRSHRYYYEALAKAYDTWLTLQAWPRQTRDALMVKLNDGLDQKTKRGDGLHVLLRALIWYTEPESKKEDAKQRRNRLQRGHRRLGRDVAALRFALRKRVSADAFVDFVQRYRGGLDRMAVEEAALSDERASGAVRTRRTLTLVWPAGLKDEVLDALEESQGVALYLCPSNVAGQIEVAVAHNIDRSKEEWCARLPGIEPLSAVEN